VTHIKVLRTTEIMKNVRTDSLTCEACGLLERYADLGGVPSAVTAVKEKGRLANCA
jgi:hypothetical protein